MAFNNKLAARSQDLSDWYLSVVEQAKLADYGPVKGTMIILPYGYAIWENIVAFMDRLIKEKGVQNAYFPLFIPESFLKKEASHVEGFAPECAYVTIGGGQELTERLVVRPTSETIMYHTYAKLISSHRDLPLVLNQWNNVVRWEKRTFPFLRTSEFLWQEGHGAHATQEENYAMVEWGIHLYETTFKDLLAVPGIVGKKSESEKFAGAVTTLTYEALMPSGKSLQSCTSHDLGQNFSKTFDIKFQDKDGQSQYVWQNSWGFSTRSVGAMVLAHGDDKGLVLPPRVAPTQVIILVVRPTDELVSQAQNIASELKKAGLRVQLDADDTKSLGYRINEAEIKGIPLRLELGQRELDANQLTLVKRNTGEKLQISKEDLILKIPKLLDTIHNEMYQKAKTYQDNNIRPAKTYDEFKTILETHRGFIKVFWNQNKDIEAKIKAECKCVSRCMPLDQTEEAGVDFITGQPSSTQWIFAPAY